MNSVIKPIFNESFVEKRGIFYSSFPFNHFNLIKQSQP